MNHAMELRQSIGTFTCNICGTRNRSHADTSEREQATCSGCQSSLRFRSIVLSLSRALFGIDLKLPDFPLLKSIRGLGVSDSQIYSGRLDSCFSYINTFYHRDPRLDLLQPDESEFGKYDFVICSDVLEHVPDPVNCAFTTLARLLKPTGFLILTAPYSLEPSTIEHYPEIVGSAFAEIDDRTVLVGRSADGEYHIFDQLTFHGGMGQTLERRVFSEESIRANLSAAGFPLVRFDVSGNRGFGVVFSSACSLPIIAAKAPHMLSLSGITELVEQVVAKRAILAAVKSSAWIRLGRVFGVGPDLIDS